MQKYQENVIGRVNGALAPMKDVQVTVTDTATNLLAALYSDDGITPLPQPLYTDENGLFSFYAADGKYTLTFSGKRVTTYTREVVLDDPAENPFMSKQELALVNGASKVGYGTRTVSDKLGEVASIDDFPGTDASEKLANAVARFKIAGGGRVRVPAGAHNWSETVTVDSSNIKIECAGADRSQDGGDQAAGAATVFNWTGAAGGTKL